MQAPSPHAAHAAIGKLNAGAKREIPVFPQQRPGESAICCLAMVLSYFGREVRLDEMRVEAFKPHGGDALHALVAAASLYDLRARSVHVEHRDFAQLEAGTILQFAADHFVVFERTLPGAIRVVDPAGGRRDAPEAEVRQRFTGVAVVFELTERFRPYGGTGRAVWRHLRHAITSSKLWGRIVVTSLVLQFFALGLPLINARLIDRVVPRNDYHLLGVLVLGLGGSLLAYFFTSMVRSYLLLNLRTEFNAKTTIGFTEHLLRLPYWYFKRILPADLISRVNSTHYVQEVVTSTLLSASIDGLLVISYLAVLMIISLKMAGLAVVLVLFQALAFIGTRRTLYELSFGSIGKQTDANNLLNEMLTGIETLRVTGGEARALARWADVYTDMLNIGLRRGGVAAWSESLLTTIKHLAPFVLLLAGVYQVMQGELTLGIMLSAHSFGIGFISPMANLLHYFTQLQMLGGSLDRLEGVLSTPPEQAPNLRLAPPFTGAIELRSLSFTYMPRTPNLLRGINLRIQAGQHVAIVGRSGSGKSTLASLLVGLHQPTEGYVLFDGQNVLNYDLRSVRRQMGMVNQRAYLFGTTLRENIALNDPSVSLERIRRAAKRACIDDEIMRLPHGYETPVTAGGMTLSAGQRQRVLLARALVGEPPILILDEATEGIGGSLADEIDDQIARLTCTRIVITHRLSAVARADLIVVMENGAIIESGSHEQLLAKRGHYSLLVTLQKRGQLPDEPPPPAAPPAPLNPGFAASDSWATIGVAAAVPLPQEPDPDRAYRPPPADRQYLPPGAKGDAYRPPPADRQYLPPGAKGDASRPSAPTARAVTRLPSAQEEELPEPTVVAPQKDSREPDSVPEPTIIHRPPKRRR